MSTAGYTNLLAHLHNPSTPLPLETIQAAIAHHLSQLSPLPTPLAAIIVSSPFFLAYPFTHQKLQALFTSFRHATHLKCRELARAEENQSVVNAVFARSSKTRMRLWAGAVLKGIKGGQPIPRLACCGGLLAGLEDLKTAEQFHVGGQSKLEDEVVIAVAEAMDTYSYRYSGSSASTVGGWETEFQPVGDVDAMTLALILASQSLQLVAPGKLKALPLAVLTNLLTFAVTSTFSSGTFLSIATSSTSKERADLPSSPTLRNINESPLMTFIAPISKLTAMTLTILCESRPLEGMRTAVATLEALRPMSKTLESDWISGSWATILNGGDEQDTFIAPETATVVWSTLKTLLFSNIMIADAVLSAAIYIPPSESSPTPSTLALTVLHNLSSLSFVISQFGGVTTTASPGFVELKKTFYLALDILAQSEEESDRFVRELCLSLQAQDTTKKAYALASIEQLVPVLSGECIQSHALPLCLPHLSEPTHREAYESSHSVVLAIFAAHADRHAADGKEPASDAISFTERMVPFYAHCLIENSADGMLNTPQLCLAFSSLVRSASASGKVTPTDDTYTLAWYCIDALLDTIHELSSLDVERNPSAAGDRLHHLHLTLISTVPSLPLKLLPRVLQEIKNILMAPGGKVKELADAMFVEISQRVGDREKEYVMRWWYDNRDSFHGGEDESLCSAPDDHARL